MLALSHSQNLANSFLLDKTVFQESVRREPRPPCVHVTQMEHRTDIYTIPKLNEEEDN